MTTYQFDRDAVFDLGERGAICAWLAANDVDARLVPVDARLTIDGDRLTVQLHALNGNGRRYDMTDQAMESNCEHAYATRVRGGEPVSVRACSLCGQPDWPDLRQQVEQLCAAAALEAQHRTALAFQPDDPLRRPSAEQQRLFLEQFARDYPGVDPELPAIPADPRKAG